MQPPRRISLQLLSTTSVLAFALSPASANPTGGIVAGGSANAVISNPAANQLLITQSTSRAIINWNSFSIAAGESTQFVVPAGGGTLNRVTSGNPSAIYGSLSSNGQLILVNPNGIVVGPSGQINTAGLILSTANISDKAFLAGGDLNFKVTSNAAIVNQGTITSPSGGDIFIIARHIDNSGTISSPRGTVGLAAGTDVLIRATDTGEGRIMVRPGFGTIRSSGRIAAVVAELRAAGGNHYALAVNNTGVVRATGASMRNGHVYLTASHGALSSAGSSAVRMASAAPRSFAGHASAHRSSAHGSASHSVFQKVHVAVKERPTAIHLVKRTVVHKVARAAVDISGTVNVSNPNGVGGKVIIEGPTIHLASSAIVMASGSTGGGTVMIGGGAHGTDASIVNAQSVVVDAGAIINADSTVSGNAGQVVVWSDVSTNFAGTVSAQALGASGNGGSVEVSGGTLTYNGTVNAMAANGATGALLLDPGQVNIVHDTTNAANTVDTFQDDKVAAALATADVTIQTANATGANGANQDIVIQPGVVIDWNASVNGNTSLTLQAGRDITAYDNVNIQNRGVGTANQQGGIVFDAGRNILIGDAGVTGNLGTARTGAVTIGSQYGVTRMVSGDPGFTATAVGGPTPGAAGFVSVTGGDTAGTYAQIGYNGAAPKAALVGGGFAQAGAINVAGGGAFNAGGVATTDVALTGGTAAGAFAQIGDGGVGAGAGVAGSSIGDIYGATITVTSPGGSVALNSRGIETSYAQIGDGYSLTLPAGTTTVGNVSGDISVLSTVVTNIAAVTLNGTVTPTLANAPGNVAALAIDNPNVFMAQIGNGSHIQVPTTASTLTTGNIAGTITVGGAGFNRFGNLTLGSAIAPGTYTANLITGVNPVTGAPVTTPQTVTAPAYQVFSQIGHGNFVRLGSAVGASAGTYNLNLGSIAPLIDPTGITVGTGISVAANSITITSVETPTNNPVVYSNLVRNIEDGQIGSGNVVRQEEGTNATGTGNTTTLTEGDITGNISVITNPVLTGGVTLTSTINGGVATTAAQGGTIPANVTNDQMLARVGHGSFVQLETASGAAGNAGGSINYTQANVLQSAILVQTQNATAPITLASSITAAGGTAANPAGNIVTSTVLSAIGSGGEAELRTGNGGASAALATAAANAGDITFAKGTVWDGFEPTGLIVSNYVPYDSSIQIISANAINVTTAQTAGGSVAGGGGAVDNNNGLARIGHGSFVTLASGNGGSATQAGATNGGRGGDITVTQQTPGRDYGGTGAADDDAWGLRGQISLQAITVDPPIAVTVQSTVTAGIAVASNNSNSAQIGHGDFISAVSGNGGNGGPSNNGAIPVGITAFGARAGNVNIDLHNMLIESNIVSSDNNAVQGAGGAAQNTYAASLGLALGNGITPTLANGTGITGEVVVNSVTTNGQGAIGAASASQNNWSDATIGHGEAVFVKSGNGGGGGGTNGAASGAFLTNGVPVQTSEAITDAYFSINPAAAAPAGGTGIVGAGAVGSGAATGGNGGDIQVLLGTVTNRTGTIGLGTTGLLHNGNANVLLTVKGANAGVSLLVNSQIVSGPNVDGNGDDVSATVGARTKVLAVGGVGGAGGNANASFDPYIALGFGAGTMGIAAVPIQSDASGGRGGDVMIGVGSGVTGTKTVTITGAAGNPAPGGAAVIGNVVIQADGAVTVSSTNQGGYALTNSNIGNYAEISGVAQAGGAGGTLYGTGAVLGQSGANDGIADTNGPAVQLVFNYNANNNTTTGVGEGVSVLGNGNLDTVTSIAAERTAAVTPAVANAIFYDVSGNPELIENAGGTLVANNAGNNTAFAGNANNMALFGRTVATYNAGIAFNNVQYVQLGFGRAGAAPIAATGRPDLVVGVLTGTVGKVNAGYVSVVDVNNNHVYDQISGRVRLANGNLPTFGLLDYTAVTGITPTVTAQNTLIWSGTAAAGTAPSATLNGNIAGLDTPVTGLSTPADGLMSAQLGSLPAFSTSNGGRGGDVGTQVGWTVGNVVVDAGLAPATAALQPVSVSVASSTNGLTAAAGGGVGPGFGVAQAHIGDAGYQISDTGGYDANRIAGSTFPAGFVSGAANGGNAGGNAVNASGGRAGNAALIQGAQRTLYVVANPNGTISNGSSEFDFLVGNVLVNTNVNAATNGTVVGGVSTYRPGGISITATDDNDVTSNVSTATVGQGAFVVAGASNPGANAGNASPAQAGDRGGNGTSFAGNAGGPAAPISTITQVANGGMGGMSTATQGQLKGLVTVMAGPQTGGTNFSVLVQATKGATGPAAAGGGAQPPGDSNDTILAQIGDGRLATVVGGTGGTGASARYQANGGAGGSASLTQLAILDTAILVDSFTYSTTAGGNGVSVNAVVNQGGAHLVRAQIGHGDVAFASGGAGGAGTPDASITENLNQTALGGNSGNATITQGTFASALVNGNVSTVVPGSFDYIDQNVTVSAGSALTGPNAVSVTSSILTNVNTAAIATPDHIVATIGQGSYASAATQGGGAGGGNGGRIPGITTGVDPAFYQGLDVAAAAANAQTALAPLERNALTLGTYRNGGNGGNATVNVGDIGFATDNRSGTGAYPLGILPTAAYFPNLSYGINNLTGQAAVSVTAHNSRAVLGGASIAGFNGILVQAMGGRDANTTRLVDANVATIGNTTFTRADATAAVGGNALQGGIGSTISEGNGGNGGLGVVTTGAMVGDIMVTNVVAGEMTNTGTTMDTNITVQALDQSQYDSSAHQTEARIGDRVYTEAYGGAGGAAANPAPNTNAATISALGGIGGLATSTSGAIVSNINVTAENSVLVLASNANLGGALKAGAPFLVATIGADQEQAAVAGAGGVGGTVTAVNVQNTLNALARFKSLGGGNPGAASTTAFGELSAYDQMLIDPIVHGYYSEPGVTQTMAGPGIFTPTLTYTQLKDITPLLNQIVTYPVAPATYSAATGTVQLNGLARDATATFGTPVPVSAAESATLVGLAAGAGQGGAASIVQGVAGVNAPFLIADGIVAQHSGITGNIAVVGIGANTGDPARGVQVVGSSAGSVVAAGVGATPPGAEVALVGNEQTITRDIGGAGPNVRAFSTGIGGDGGAASATQNTMTGNVTLTAGSLVAGTTTNLTQGEIVVSANDAGQVGNQVRAWVGSRQSIGSDRVSYRPAAIVAGGAGGSDTIATANGYLGNGGAVTIVQAGMPGLYDAGGNQIGTNDIRLQAYSIVGMLPNSVQILSTEAATMVAGQTSVEIGNSILAASAAGGNGGVFANPGPAPQGLYGVRQANGGSVSFDQGTLTPGGQSDAIVATVGIEGTNAVLIQSMTSAANGTAAGGGNTPIANVADLTIGNEMIAGDQKYGGGFYNGTQVAGGYGGVIAAGNGGNAPIEDVNSGNGAPGQTDASATPVYDSNGGNVLMSLGSMRVTATAANTTNAPLLQAIFGTAITASNLASNVVTVTSDLGNTSVIANAADGGHSVNFIGQQRYVNVTTGLGGGTATAETSAAYYTAGQGGSAVITRNTVSGNVVMQSLSTVSASLPFGSETRVDAISTTAGTAQNLVGQTVTFGVTSGRGGYGTDVFATGFNVPDAFGFASGPGLDGELGSFVGAGTATYRDAVVAVHTIENVVAVLTLVNANAARYSAADKTLLATNLTAAQTALTAAQTALGLNSVAGVQAAATNARTALDAVHARVTAIGNGYADQVSNNAIGGNITYTAIDPVLGSTAQNEGSVSGNITLQAAPYTGLALMVVPAAVAPATAIAPFGVGIVRVTAEGGGPTNQTATFNANAALSEVGHRYAITNTSGVGGGSHTGAATDGGIAGNGGAIAVSQTTTGNVALSANTVVLTPTSGTTGTATVQILADVNMTNIAGDSDVAADLGQGGAITATQATSGTASVNANYISSTDTATGAAANDMLSANQNLAASVLGIGILATSNNNSTSDTSPGGTHPSDANRGGIVVASQTVTPDANNVAGNMFALNLDLNATGTHKRDLIIAANGGTFAAGFPTGAGGTNAANTDVRIGSYATQTAVSGNNNDGSDVTATQSVIGNIATAAVEDMLITNAGTGAAGVHIGQTGVQTAQSGLINDPNTDYYGGVTTAAQTVTGAITLPVSRSFAMTTSMIQTFTPTGGALTVAPATDALQIGSNATQTATSADRRSPLTTTYPHYPQVATAATPNVVANQTSGGAIAITAAQVNLTDANNRAVVAPTTTGVLGFAPVAGVQIGNASAIIVDTQRAGIVMSTSATTGTVAITTTNPALAPAQQDGVGITTALLGDINLTEPAQTVMNAAGTAVIANNNGVVQVGASSTSTVSHDPAGGQGTGTFTTAQNIGNPADPTAQPISINTYDNLSLTEGAAGMAGQTGGAGQARIGDYINETGLPAGTIVQDGSIVAQSVSSNINANVGNSLGLVSQDTGGLVQIGHYSPPANAYEINEGVVVTPQTLSGAINVLVGTAVAKAAVGDVTNPATVSMVAPAIGALGTNNILIDTNGGTFQNNPGAMVAVQQEVGGEARIGSRFASPIVGGMNQTQTAQGNIFVQAGSHLTDIGGGLGLGSVIGHGPYDYTDAPTVRNTSNTVAAVGVIRNRVLSDTSVGALQNSPNYYSNVSPNFLTFDASAGTVSVNSGYGGQGNADVMGQLRFFIPARTNLTINPSTGSTATLVTSANVLPIFNDSVSNADSTLARTNNNTNIFQGQGGQDHEQPFQLMGTMPNYTQTYLDQYIGTGNYTFYFKQPTAVTGTFVYIADSFNYAEQYGTLRYGFECALQTGDRGSIGSFGGNHVPGDFSLGYDDPNHRQKKKKSDLAAADGFGAFGLDGAVFAGACNGGGGGGAVGGGQAGTLSAAPDTTTTDILRSPPVVTQKRADVSVFPPPVIRVVDAAIPTTVPAPASLNAPGATRVWIKLTAPPYQLHALSFASSGLAPALNDR